MNDGMNAQDKGINQAAIGMQQYLIITQVPTGAAGALVNNRLLGKTLTVAGDYYCKFYMGGVTALHCWLKATFGGGETCESTVYSTFKNGEGPDSSATLYEAFASDGPMSTGSLQESTLADSEGVQFGIVKLTITGTGGVEFTVAEVNGR